jgi:hypothetical protein
MYNQNQLRNQLCVIIMDLIESVDYIYKISKLITEMAAMGVRTGSGYG